MGYTENGNPKGFYSFLVFLWQIWIAYPHCHRKPLIKSRERLNFKFILFSIPTQVVCGNTVSKFT